MRRDGEPVIFAFTVATAAAGLVSIAASQILLAATYLLWLYIRPRPFRWPSYFVPLLVFVATTLISLAASPDSSVGWHPIHKFWLFPMGLLATNFVTTEWRAGVAYRLLLAVGALAAAAGIIQFPFAYLKYLRTGLQADDPTLLARMTGTLDHWMTFSGVELLVWCAAVPALIVLGQKWLVPLSAIGTALVLSFTRSAWVAAAAGFAAIAFALPRRVLAAVVIPMVVVALVTSPLIFRRVSMSFDKGLATNFSRKEYFKVGIRMIRDHPLFGVGPERVHYEFSRYYRGPALGFYGHVHNNILQIGAERGLLCLAAFLWFVLELYRSLLKLLRTHTSAPRWATLGALSALTGFLVSGLAEYNFGDSEVLMLMLFIVSVPFGLSHHVQKDPHSQQG